MECYGMINVTLMHPLRYDTSTSTSVSCK